MDISRIWKPFWSKSSFYFESVQALQNYSKKKTLQYKERDENKRKIFLEQIATQSTDHLVFVDESGIDSFIHRSYGRSKKGQLVFGEISSKHFYRESFIAAKCDSKILAPFCFQGTCNTQLFEFWVEKFLIPDLKPNQTVIMDNATFHKSKKTQTLIEKANCQLLFLPPYSPDLNPIEKFWAWFKAKVRSFIHQFPTLSTTIDHVFNL